MGEGAVLKPVGDALPVDGLLTHARYHLRDVDEGTLRERENKGKIPI
jgi:hypothetical protein